MWQKTSLAWFCCLFDLEYSKISPEKQFYCVDVSEGCRSEINKAALE